MVLCREQGSSLWHDGNPCACWVRLVTLLPFVLLRSCSANSSPCLCRAVPLSFPLQDAALHQPLQLKGEHHSHRCGLSFPPLISRFLLSPASPRNGFWKEQWLQEHGDSFPSASDAVGSSAGSSRGPTPRRPPPRVALPAETRSSQAGPGPALPRQHGTSL